MKAHRDNAAKPQLAYALDFPKALERLAAVMTYGAQKYAEDNWKLGGKPDREYLDACLRHLAKFKAGEKIDPESDCCHIAHAAWNLLALIELNL